jgi:hypothetical protein
MDVLTAGNIAKDNIDDEGFSGENTFFTPNLQKTPFMITVGLVRFIVGSIHRRVDSLRVDPSWIDSSQGRFTTGSIHGRIN